MAKRIVTRIGDVFCVEVAGRGKYYFQYVDKDMTQLGGQVIRAFKTCYPMDYKPVPDDIVRDEVSFYALTFIRVGLYYDAWYKVGSSKIIGTSELKNVMFGVAHRWISLPDLSSKEVNPLDNWYIWHVNQKHEGIGRLPESYSSVVYPGAVIPFHMIINRIVLGYYTNTSPEYSVLKRVPLPYVDSYVRREDDGVETYFHFLGEYAVRQVVVANGKKVRLTKDTPEAGGYRLRSEKFGETNWKHHDFMTAEEFDSIWNGD